ncbi:hypothetical protein LCGC14_0357310 [marine sediment metagenome]|uniref:Uncharacterized protein n=1 Tax=marine sediment metagenome TaxID=412755 RepID=A0A0F9TS16_9ZZZZ
MTVELTPQERRQFIEWLEGQQTKSPHIDKGIYNALVKTNITMLAKLERQEQEALQTVIDLLVSL